MKYEPEKNEPKTMKAKADLMLKRGSISETQHKKLHAKADVEIAKGKAGKGAKIAPAKKVDDLSAKGGQPMDGADDAPGKDADATETPAKRKAATKKPVMRGQVMDEEEHDD